MFFKGVLGKILRQNFSGDIKKKKNLYLFWGTCSFALFHSRLVLVRSFYASAKDKRNNFHSAEDLCNRYRGFEIVFDAA